MCGIFALFLKRPLLQSDIEKGRAAVEALRHRGPNSDGEWMDRERGVYIGHCRLSIVDLSDASDQPMVRDGSVFAYNGEVYNHHDLRRRLEGLGASFQTTGDTEVFLRALQTLGPDAHDAVDGMFAYALWDGETATLATDPFGEKDLYYAETPDGVFVSSELLPLATVLRAKPDLSGQTLTAFMALDYVPAPDTAFAGIKRLGPAKHVRIRSGQIREQKRYWRPVLSEPRDGPVKPLTERDLDRVHEVLHEAAAGRFKADAPMCAFLSSGADSNLVVAMAAKDFGAALQCITVRFADGALDESEAARKSAELLKLDHVVVDSEADPNDTDPDFFLKLFGQPNGNLTIASIYQVARAGAERGFRVGLTGMGGDELFFGYQKHSFFYKYRWLYSRPEWLRLAVGALLRPVSSGTNNLAAYRALLSVRDCERYIAKKNQPTIDILRALPGFAKWTEAAFPPDATPLEYAVPSYEISEVMPNSHLPALDLGSMRASLELRTPFLSRKLQETVAQFDPRSLVAFGQKSVVRRLLRRYLPAEIVDAPKRGFVFPQHTFLERYGDQQPSVPGLSPEYVRQLWARRHENGYRRLAVRAVLAQQFARWADAA